MTLPHILLIAVGLAADAFAVSLAEGVALREVSVGHTTRVAAHFGVFQAAMPVVGWLAGSAMQSWLACVDHWVAFGLLALIGGKMLLDAATNFEAERVREPSCGARLLCLSVATSIDALAVGMSLAMLQVRIWVPALVIGLVTGGLSALGVQIGDRVGRRLGRWAEAAGGIVLCLIGLEILVHHMR
ncbi:MAG: manganese efflux pump [Candidatus Brocadiaceae bacterium]|nr:manganese efflux pump [Candidatus Brocadiaceae bacterium]